MTWALVSVSLGAVGLAIALYQALHRAEFFELLNDNQGRHIGELQQRLKDLEYAYDIRNDEVTVLRAKLEAAAHANPTKMELVETGYEVGFADAQPREEESS